MTLSRKGWSRIHGDLHLPCRRAMCPPGIFFCSGYSGRSVITESYRYRLISRRYFQTISIKPLKKPITILAQGSFAVGGKILREKGIYDENHPLNPEGQEKHVDHGYVFYQIPVNPKKVSLTFLHGAGQSGASFETTPDGREGFQTIFLRKGYPVYLFDQPRRGRAGSAGVPVNILPKGDEALWFDIFRIGHYPDRFPNSQFPCGNEAEDQFWRKVTPNTGDFDVSLVSEALSEAVSRAGDTVLITHSQGASPGWFAAMRNPKVKGIIALEPGVGFVFPKGEVPLPMESSSPFGPLKGVPVSAEDFRKLTKLPILMVFGDNIPETPSPYGGQDNWRVRLQSARLMAEAINKRGGHAEVLCLPEIGIYGNTHFLFEDQNNEEIAEVLEKWLMEEGPGK